MRMRHSIVFNEDVESTSASYVNGARGATGHARGGR
jgi:hypothetical protein